MVIFKFSWYIVTTVYIE